MADYQSFNDRLEKAAVYFKELAKDNVVRIISHLDADGISSSALIIKALRRENIKFVHSTVKQLSEDVLEQLQEEEYNLFVFTDLGAGQLELIKDYIGEKKIFVLDHHSFDHDLLEELPENINVVNPHIYEIDGSSTVSGAGVVYLFTEKLDEKNKDMAHLAIVGAIGDMQEDEGFNGINEKILEISDIKVKKDMRWYGIKSKSLVELLTFRDDPEIPGITGSESNVIQFLNNIGIDPKKCEEWVRYDELDDEQKNKLISSIIVKRAEGRIEKPDDILGNRYFLPDGEDAKEFSTLLNSCGRMDKPDYGIGLCLGDKRSKEKAGETLDLYRKEIVEALQWYRENKDLIKGENYIIINAEDNIRPTIIGTVASILSKDGELEKDTIILSLAELDEDNIKASIRIVGDNEELNLKDLIQKITENSHGEAGGHKNAAGAIIPKEHIEEFISEAKKIL